MRQHVLLTLAALLLASPALAVEKKTLGKETIEPGIKAEFQAETTDMVLPKKHNLSPQDSDVHLEALINWGEMNPPKNKVRGDFVPYLDVKVTITDEKTNKSDEVTLYPHISADDGVHYGRNIKLPGSASDPYTFAFTVDPPAEDEMNYHSDWVKKYGPSFFTQRAEFTYKNIDLSAVVHSRRDTSEH